MYPDYEDMILQRQEAYDLYEEGVDADTIAEMYPDVDFDDDDVLDFLYPDPGIEYDDFDDIEILGE